jgi:hypothetical protein
MRMLRPAIRNSQQQAKTAPLGPLVVTPGSRGEISGVVIGSADRCTQAGFRPLMHTTHPITELHG